MAIGDRKAPKVKLRKLRLLLRSFTLNVAIPVLPGRWITQLSFSFRPIPLIAFMLRVPNVPLVQPRFDFGRPTRKDSWKCFTQSQRG